MVNVKVIANPDGQYRFRSHITIIATGGYGKVYYSATSAHTCTGDGNAMVLRAGFVIYGIVPFHPTGIYGVGCLITEWQEEKASLVTGKGERFMKDMHLTQKT